MDKETNKFSVARNPKYKGTNSVNFEQSHPLWVTTNPVLEVSILLINSSLTGKSCICKILICFYSSSVRESAAREWCLWEMSTSKLIPDTKYLDKADNLEFAAAFSRYSRSTHDFPRYRGQLMLSPGIGGQLILSPGIRGQLMLSPGIGVQLMLSPGIGCQLMLSPGIQGQLILSPGIGGQPCFLQV